jgi:hypothetical protein
MHNLRKNNMFRLGLRKTALPYMRRLDQMVIRHSSSYHWCRHLGPTFALEYSILLNK